MFQHWEDMASHQHTTTYYQDRSGTLSSFFKSNEAVMPRVCMLGRKGVGMNSLVHRYVYNEFDTRARGGALLSKIDMGIATLANRKSMKISICSFLKNHIEENLFVSQIIRLGGYGVKLHDILPFAECILFVFDLTDKSTLFATLELFRMARTQNQSFVPLLVGTKYDLFADKSNGDKVDMAWRVWTIVKAMNAPLIYTSAKNGDNVKNVFRMIMHKSLDVPSDDIEQKHDELNEALIYCPRSVTESICIVFGYIRCIAPGCEHDVPFNDISNVVLMFYANIGGRYNKEYVTESSEWKEKIEEIEMIGMVGNSLTKLPAELRFKPGDIVKMVQLKSKKEWNGKYATIIGAFSKQKKRWPVQINFGDRASASLQVKNLRVHQLGHGWI